MILETGELQTYDNVRRASWLAMLAGADFIKTSTGKISPAATLPVTLVMLEACRDWRDATGAQIGVKPAGGIRTTKDAIKYLVLVNETVGHGLAARPTCSASAPPACSTTCCCSARSWPPAATPAPTTSPSTDAEDQPCPPPSSTPRRPSRAPSSTSRRRTACSSTASSSTAPAARLQDASTRPPRRCSPRSPTPARPTSTAP